MEEVNRSLCHSVTASKDSNTCQWVDAAPFFSFFFFFTKRCYLFLFICLLLYVIHCSKVTEGETSIYGNGLYFYIIVILVKYQLEVYILPDVLTFKISEKLEFALMSNRLR